ncbi:protein Aster-B-like isoform X2 [Zerene cesonia]|uniref:protein Aster-B-like isoform X2 n=1 Tax=Zerene cesonia TaxID=33412 RepID=UPI0018E53F98|nr:protein Aster-B-like isoform X2 [Zerene cesonia]
MTSSELESRNVPISMRKSVENLVISSQDAIGQSISQALSFSGMSNPVYQETKNLSRSPSPSLRITEAKQDNNIDSEYERSDVPLGAGDAPVGVDAALAAALKPDFNKLSNPGSRSSDGSGRAKKKSWYNSLYPTYKSKSEDFKRLFKDLPDDERLIVDYSCALQRDILAHGRLYASQSYLCFYASIFGWETSLTLRWKDVTAITKEKTALVIPNAILVCTDSDKNFLTSFSGRDKAYLMLFRIWQNALMDQPLTTNEIWQWVHTCYGEELGFDSDDEGYTRDAPDEPTQPPDTSEEAVDTSSMDAGGTDSRDARDVREVSPALLTNGDADGDALPTDMSDTSESEPDRNSGEEHKCTSPHTGKVLLKEVFPFNIDQLFTMIFTNSQLNLELLAVRGATDYVQSPWQPAGGVKCRQVSYTLGLTSGPIGPKEVHVNETQIMNKCSKPGYLYSINCSSENSGIPYADYFSVEAHYCFERVHDTTTRLTIYGWVNYKKSMWPMVKAFLEKNTINGMEEFSRLLESQLRAQLAPAAPAARARRRRRHDVKCEEIYVSPPLCPAPVAAAPPAASRAPRWLLVALVLLLLLNALLYTQLYYYKTEIDMDELHTKLSGVRSAAAAQWSAQLARHTLRQRRQLLAWRDALATTVAHLAQTEQSLAKLLETIKPVLEKSETDDRHGEL